MNNSQDISMSRLITCFTTQFSFWPQISRSLLLYWWFNRYSSCWTKWNCYTMVIKLSSFFFSLFLLVGIYIKTIQLLFIYAFCYFQTLFQQSNFLFIINFWQQINNVFWAHNFENKYYSIGVGLVAMTNQITQMFDVLTPPDVVAAFLSKLQILKCSRISKMILWQFWQDIKLLADLGHL